MMSLAVILELATLVAYITVIYGGKQQRDKGWKVVCSLLGVCVAIQCASMAIVVSARVVGHTFRSNANGALQGLPLRS